MEIENKKVMQKYGLKIVLKEKEESTQGELLLGLKISYQEKNENINI